MIFSYAANFFFLFSSCITQRKHTPPPFTPSPTPYIPTPPTASVPATFGAPVPPTPGFSGPLLYLPAFTSCTPFADPTTFAGAIVLVDSSNCSFVEQATNVQNAGGVAMVVVNVIDYIPNLVVNANAYIPAVCHFVRVLCCGYGNEKVKGWCGECGGLHLQYGGEC
jgi:hypothetical protein